MSAIRILIVEDDADTATSQSSLLEQLGYKVFVAANGLAALDCAAQFHPQIILLDLGLPVVDGWEIARDLRQKIVEHPPFIIALSAHDTDEDVKRSLEAGIDVHLGKPVDQGRLREFLQGWETGSQLLMA